MEFYCYELDQTIKAKNRPLVIITSNNEKDLPDAFLRRCFFHHIAFPERGVLEKIISVHIPKIKKKLLKEAIDVFFDIRKVPGMKKKPSTSELIDWLKLIVSDDIAQEVIASKNKNLVPPLYGALLKNEQDVELLQRLAFMTRRESS
jgi:MoxR-like ATPase